MRPRNSGKMVPGCLYLVYSCGTQALFESNEAGLIYFAMLSSWCSRKTTLSLLEPIH